MRGWISHTPLEDVGSFAVDGYRRSEAWRAHDPAQRGCLFESYAHAERALFAHSLGFASSESDAIAVAVVPWPSGEVNASEPDGNVLHSHVDATCTARAARVADRAALRARRDEERQRKAQKRAAREVRLVEAIRRAVRTHNEPARVDRMAQLNAFLSGF